MMMVVVEMGWRLGDSGGEYCSYCPNAVMRVEASTVLLNIISRISEFPNNLSVIFPPIHHNYKGMYESIWKVLR